MCDSAVLGENSHSHTLGQRFLVCLAKSTLIVPKNTLPYLNTDQRTSSDARVYSLLVCMVT